MITRTHLALTVLITSSMMIALFLMFPARSQVGTYNPWADYNGDGLVDILDIVPAAASFGTSGDSTKNVNVTNWPVTKQQTVFWARTTSGVSAIYWASGFGHMHRVWHVPDLSGVEKVTFTILGRMSDGVYWTDFTVSSLEVTLSNRDGGLSFPVPSESFEFYVAFDPGTTTNVYLAFYLTYA